LKEDKLVKTSILMDKQVSTLKNQGINSDSEKLHIGGAPQGHFLRGVQFFYHFGVHRVRRNDRKIVTTNQVSESTRLRMKSFCDAIKKKTGGMVR